MSTCYGFYIEKGAFYLCVLSGLCGEDFFGLFTNLPADALGAKLTIAAGIGAAAAFFTVSLAEFLTDGHRAAFGVIDAVHISFPDGDSSCFTLSCKAWIFSSRSSMARS